MNKCFLAKSPVGSLPFVHREISHCGEIQGSRADAKQMRGKRSSAGSTARDAAQGNPARLSNFRSKSVVLLAEEFLRKGLPKSVALPAEVSKIRPPRRGGFLLAEVSCGAGGGLVRAKGAAAGCAAQIVAVDVAKSLKRYAVYPSRTDFVFSGATFHFAQPQPREIALQLLMLERLCQELGVQLKTDLSKMPMPPGRSSYFAGIKGIKIVDSSYNAHLISMASILNMAREMKTGHKWLVIGDIVDEGQIEEEEHKKLAGLIAKVKPELVILVGRRTKKYTAPVLRRLGVPVRTTVDPKKALAYIRSHVTGEETLIFKGSQYLEWIIEKLLQNPEDAQHLPRREAGAIKRRRKWGLDA